MKRIAYKNFILVSILVVVLLGSFNYALLHYVGITNNIIVQFANLLLVTLLLVLTFGGLKSATKIPVEFLLIAILVFGGFLIGIFSISITEMIPTSIRFLTYLLVGTFAYNSFLKQRNLDYLIKVLKYFVKIQAIFIIFFSFLEIFLGELEFINGVYRVSGGFKGHALGQALYLFTIIILYFELIISPEGRIRIGKKFNWKKITNLIIFFSLLYFFFRTGSRLLIIDLVLVYLLYYFVRIKSVKTFFKIGILSTIFIYAFYLLIINTQVSPRLKWMITSEQKITEEASTNTRIHIITKAIKNLNTKDYIFGIGIGGFNKYYERISGKKNHAAHNNYLQFLVETGIGGLALYFIFQLAIFLRLTIIVRKSDFVLYKIAFLLFVGIDIIAFLNNNYYFPFSEILVWLILGSAIRKTV